MSTLFVWREKLREIYAKHSTYILKALQLILGLVLFGLINVNIGFMEMAGQRPGPQAAFRGSHVSSDR